jgi:hypothetical protein
MTTGLNRWTDAALEPLRGVGDEVADAVIASLVERGDAGEVSKPFASLVSNDAPVPAELPPVVRDYFAQTEGLPSWSDPELILAGEEVFEEFGPHIVASLFCASLPECYAAAKGAHVLALTARMQQAPFRRILETGQFIFDVMGPGGLSEDGKGLRTAQKVRLMHAGVRHMCKTDPSWQMEWGEPINQEDLAGTLMTFSTVVLDSIERLGLPVTKDQEEAYFHAWRNVGHVMGIRAEVLPADVDDGRALMDAIRRRQYTASQAGEELTGALLKLMSTVVPGLVFNPVPARLIRFLIGDQTADLLSVPGIDALERDLLRAGAAVEHALATVADRDGAVDAVFAVFNRKLLEGLVWVALDGSRPTFQIPQALVDRWTLHRA